MIFGNSSISFKYLFPDIICEYDMIYITLLSFRYQIRWYIVDIRWYISYIEDDIVYIAER
jgi:hypothetical protein